MTAQLLIVGGKGGVGKTTIAAATALGASAKGRRCVVASVDRAHSLGDVLGQPVGPEPTPVAGADTLWAVEIDPQAELRREWGTLQSYFGRLLAYLGAGGAEAEEMAVLPGMEELLVLSRLSQLASEAGFDLCVADFAPTASALRYLSFPSLAGGALGKWIEWDRRLARLLRPLEGRYVHMPVPDDRVYLAIDRLVSRIAGLRELLADGQRTAVRLVMLAERVVLAETRRAITYLNLFGLNTDAVVANRLLPPDVELGYLQGWWLIQERCMAQARQDFAGLRLLTLPWQAGEIVGVAALQGLSEALYSSRDPALLYSTEPPLTFSADEDGVALSITLPHATGERLDLRRREQDLILTVGGWRRTIALPDSFDGRPVTGATFREGRLRVGFGPPSATDEGRPIEHDASAGH